MVKTDAFGPWPPYDLTVGEPEEPGDAMQPPAGSSLLGNLGNNRFTLPHTAIVEPGIKHSPRVTAGVSPAANTDESTLIPLLHQCSQHATHSRKALGHGGDAENIQEISLGPELDGQHTFRLDHANRGGQVFDYVLQRGY